MKDGAAWHLDKNIPIGLLIGLIVNAILGIWYASKLDSRVGVLEQREATLMIEMSKLKDSQDGSKEKLIRMESKLESILDVLKVVQMRMPVSRGKQNYPTP